MKSDDKLSHLISEYKPSVQHRQEICGDIYLTTLEKTQLPVSVARCII